jgi:hypothetical protein
MVNSEVEAIYGVLSTVACDENLRAARANPAFGTDKRRIRTKSTVMDKSKKRSGVVFIPDRRLRADVLFIRAQSTIRADGFSSAQQAQLCNKKGRDSSRHA